MTLARGARLAIDEGLVSELPGALPSRLMRGVREALDGGRGRLRMDPQELANRLGVVIDLEVERLARIRQRREQRRDLVARARQEAELFFKPIGRTPAPKDSDKARVLVLFEDNGPGPPPTD